MRSKEKMEQAEYLFSKIGYGRKNRVPRPADEDVDRLLRLLIKEYNSKIQEKGPTINEGDGYYIPRRWIPSEKIAFDRYFWKEAQRETSLHYKNLAMYASFQGMKKCKESEYEQLSLPV